MRRDAVTTVAIVCISLVVAATANGYASVRTGLIPPGQIRLIVLNGTHRPGLGREVSLKLARRGYAVEQLHSLVPNAPRREVRTQIYFDSSQATSLAAAKQMRRVFGPRSQIRTMDRLIERQARDANRPLVAIVLGSSFRGLP
jgi:hypothetical protein